jgi:hypothetical protein
MPPLSFHLLLPPSPSLCPPLPHVSLTIHTSSRAGCLIDPAGPESYDTITGLLKEFVLSNGLAMAHFGGDEVRGLLHHTPHSLYTLQVPGAGNCWEGDKKVGAAT